MHAGAVKKKEQEIVGRLTEGGGEKKREKPVLVITEHD